jgi:hypothetical protein
MDIQAFLDNLTEGAIVLRQFAIALCSMALGWYLVGQAGVKMLKWSDPRRQYGAASIGARFVVGTAFINATDYLQMQVLTWTGQGVGSANAMSVMPSGASVPRMILGALLTWVATLGVMAILKGTRLIVKAADGSGQSGSMHEDPGWTAFVYIVSGSLGVNLWRWWPA